MVWACKRRLASLSHLSGGDSQEGGGLSADRQSHNWPLDKKARHMGTAGILSNANPSDTWEFKAMGMMSFRGDSELVKEPTVCPMAWFWPHLAHLFAGWWWMRLYNKARGWSETLVPASRAQAARTLSPLRSLTRWGSGQEGVNIWVPPHCLAMLLTHASPLSCGSPL